MDMIQEVKSLSGLLSNGILITVLGFIILASIVWQRTRSTHQILSRIWTLFADKKECDDPEIDRFLKERSALMQFRFTTGVKVTSTDQAHKIIHYSKHNHIDLDDIRACGGYFDLTIPAVKDEKHIPKRWQLVVLFLLSCVFWLLTLFSFGGVILDKMIVQLKGSDTWLALDQSRAKPLLSSNSLYFNRCKENHLTLASETGFRSSDIDILCQTNKDEITTYIKTNLPEQRFSFGYLFVMSLFLGFLFFSPVRQGVAARKLRKDLERTSTVHAISEAPTEAAEYPA